MVALVLSVTGKELPPHASSPSRRRPGIEDFLGRHYHYILHDGSDLPETQRVCRQPEREGQGLVG